MIQCNSHKKPNEKEKWKKKKYIRGIVVAISCVQSFSHRVKNAQKQSEPNVNKTTHRKGCLIKWKIMSTHRLTYTHTNIYVFMCVYTGFNFYLIKNVARMRVPNCSWVGKTRLTVFN